MIIMLILYSFAVCFSFSGYKDCEALRLNQTAAGIENNIIYLNRWVTIMPTTVSNLVFQNLYPGSRTA
jgi:hypothetical protein